MVKWSAEEELYILALLLFEDYLLFDIVAIGSYMNSKEAYCILGFFNVEGGVVTSKVTFC